MYYMSMYCPRQRYRDQDTASTIEGGTVSDGEMVLFDEDQGSLCFSDADAPHGVRSWPGRGEGVSFESFCINHIPRDS